MIKKKNKPLWRGWFIFCLKLNDELITTITTEIDNLKKSFQDGCNTICRCITSLGVNTPDNSAVNTITDNIRTLYNNRYTSGYNQGIADADARVNTSSASYVAGYNAGRLQGQQDVINDPEGFGIHGSGGVVLNCTGHSDWISATSKFAAGNHTVNFTWMVFGKYRPSFWIKNAETGEYILNWKADEERGNPGPFSGSKSFSLSKLTTLIISGTAANSNSGMTMLIITVI